jgi:hypothetical protein
VVQGVGATDQVKGPIGIGADLAEVAMLVVDVGQAAARHRQLEHRRGDVHRHHLLVPGGEQGGVPAGPAAKIHRPLATPSRELRVDELVQWAADQLCEPVEMLRHVVERPDPWWRGGHWWSPIDGLM